MNGRSTARALLILITSLVVLVYYLPLGHADFTGRWGDGTYGIQLPRAGGSTVLGVDRGSPAWRAGMRAGDVLVEAPFSGEWSNVDSPRDGDRTRVTYVRNGVVRTTPPMRAVPVAGFGPWQRATGVLAVIPATIFFAIAFALVYLRPGVMTWSFYVYAVGYFSTAPSIEYFHGVLPGPAFIALLFVLATLFGNFAAMPLLPFVLRFPDENLRGWRRTVDAVIWIAMAGAYAAYVYQWMKVWGAGTPLSWGPALDEWLPLAVFVAAAAIVIQNYKTASPAVRQRTGFLIAGIIVSFIAYAVYFIPSVSVAAAQIIGYLVVLLPIAVAYAVLRHRVLDINFVLNRAIAYATLSVAVLVVVSLLDWLSGKIVSQEHFATSLEIFATILVGYLLSRVNLTFEGWVDVLLFRKRHEAERYLQRVASALPYATSEDAITDGLVHEPVTALELSAGALYRRSEDGRRFNGVGTSDETVMAPMGFERNHNLVRFLLADEDVVWLESVRSHLDAENSAIYVLAVPICVRHDLVSFVLYGAHRNGSQIDPDEVALLKALAHEAARAYDHVEAVRTRELLDRVMVVPARTT